MRRRGSWLMALALAGGVPGCGQDALDPGEPSADTVPGCPPEDPACDRLDEPCVMDEDPEASLAPGSSPLGLGSPLTSTGKHRVWPKGRVPYKIASSVGSTTKSRLLSAMNEWQTKTQERVRFEKATSADTAYVLVSEGSPRVSFVGYYSGKVANLYLRNPEYLTVTRHELGHVLGLEHEMRRKDRSTYIQVISSNIVATDNCKYQFSLCSDCALLGKYNVKSVMHYRSYRDLGGCRVGGKAVLLNKDGSAIDHEWVLTSGDLAAIAQLYPVVPGTGGTGGTSGGTGGSDAGTSGGTFGSDAGTSGGTGGSGGSGGTGTAGASGTGAAGEAGMAGEAGAAGSDGIEGDEGWSDGGIEPSSGGTGGGSNQTTSVVPADEGGCGCRMAPRRSPLAWLLFGGALLVASARRRRLPHQRAIAPRFAIR